MPTLFLDGAGVEKMMEPSFEKLLVTLADSGVRFIVVGGLAVTLNGYVRLTEVVDFVVDRTPENISCLLETLSTFGEGFGGELAPEDFDEKPGTIRVVEAAVDCQMDIFTIIGGFVFDDLVADAETASISGRTFRYASKSQLIRIKSSSSREKDKIDIIALKRLIDDPNAFR